MTITREKTMLIKSIVTIVLLATTLTMACSKETSPPKDEPAPAPTSTQPKAAPHGDHAHAVEGAKPGSHEDWCDEHQVAESQCTRCDPGLVAAFKATKDWCAEHGLPESQCLKCNPDLKIVRPPKTE